MTARRVILRVQEEDGCPLFRVGDQMIVDLPGAEASGSGPVCALTVADLLRHGDLTTCESASGPEAPESLRCPRAQRPVRFEVETIAQPRTRPPSGDLVNDIPRAVAHLRSIPIFRPLPAGFLGRLAHRIRRERRADGEVVLEKGQPGRAFFVVERGRVEVVGYAEQRMASVVTELREGDCFGEMSILTGAPVAATVRANGDVDLYVLDAGDFEQLLRDNPFMAGRFTRLMAQRLLAANYRLVQEGRKSFSGKLAVMSLPTVVQMLSDSRRSGTLRVEDYQHRVATLGFRDGHLYGVEQGATSGEEAFYGLLSWEDGDFSFDPEHVPEEDRVGVGITNLLLEGMRRLDEARRAHG